MAAVHFEMVSFHEEENSIVVNLYKIFELVIPKAAFSSQIHAKGNVLTIEETSEEEVRERFRVMFTTYLPGLRSIVTKKPAYFIHGNSGIPLIGSLAFGIVDRGTNMLEVKPITGCNINCTFCSVDEGDDSRKSRDYVVEREYLVRELEKVLAFKEEIMDIWLNTQGEPTLYAELIQLIGDIRHLRLVGKIALITNGTLLSKYFLTEVKEAGLGQLDVSINAISDKKSKELAGTNRYNSAQVRDMVEHAIQIGIDVVIAPVYLKGVNEQDIKDIVAFAQSIGCKKVYVQNFLLYRFGRNPTKQVRWKAFGKFLTELQSTYPAIDLFAKDHTLKNTKPLPKPFKTGECVEAVVVVPGRYPDELLAAAKGRCITLREMKGLDNIGKKIKITITRDKDNIFYGKAENKK